MFLGISAHHTGDDGLTSNPFQEGYESNRTNYCYTSSRCPTSMSLMINADIAANVRVEILDGIDGSASDRGPAGDAVMGSPHRQRPAKKSPTAR